MGLYQWIFVCCVLVEGQGQKGDVGVKGKVGKDGDKGTRGDQGEKGDRFGANEVNDGVDDDDDDDTDEREAEAKKSVLRDFVCAGCYGAVEERIAILETMKFGFEWQLFPVGFIPDAVRTYSCSIHRKLQDESIASFKKTFMIKLVEYLRLKLRMFSNFELERISF